MLSPPEKNSAGRSTPPPLGTELRHRASEWTGLAPPTVRRPDKLRAGTSIVEKRSRACKFLTGRLSSCHELNSYSFLPARHLRPGSHRLFKYGPFSGKYSSTYPPGDCESCATPLPGFYRRSTLAHIILVDTGPAGCIASRTWQMSVKDELSFSSADGARRSLYLLHNYKKGIEQ